jgi:uncharacterized protein YpuA (DUF1002 family)
MALSNEDLKQIRTVVQGELNNQEQKFGKKLTETKSEFFDKIDDQEQKFEKKLTKVKDEFFDKIDDQEQKFEKKLTEIKSEFFEKIDSILKEVTTAREERPLLENRIEALEKISSENTRIITS